MHAALPLDPAHPRESRGDDLEPEMGLLAALGAFMVAGVKMGVVMDYELLGRERRFELFSDALGNGHAPGIAAFEGSVKRSFAWPAGR